MARLASNKATSTALALLLPLIAAGQPARADPFVFLLHNGGRVRGNWLNSNDRPLTSYRIQTEGRGTVTLARSAVKRLIRQRPEEIQYQRIAPTHADTVDAQWQLAEWCRGRRLLKQRAVHLERILQLDPDHVGARHGLGYVQVGDRWMTRAQWRKAQGYVLYRGHWRLPQEVDLLEAARAKERAERQWLGKLKHLREDLQSTQSAEARRRLLAIRDPHAVRALRENLRSEPHRAVKLLYVKILGQIGNRDAVITLINTSLNDPDAEMFHACVDQIVRLRPPLALAAYIEGLKDNNKVRVNRSAHALGRLGDLEAIGPLIDALVTTHRMVVASPKRAGGSPLSASFARPAAPAGAVSIPLGARPAAAVLPAGGTGGTSFSAGSGQQVVSVRVPNQGVLDALVRLSGGVSFGFDQQAWKNWQALERRQSQPIRWRRTP